MARKLRLEFPGAIYHVINRGNYRAWIFQTEGARAAFEAGLFDACARYGWLLHAYVLMGNHYHLAVETPAGNLVNGMQWLQSSFANRFNKLRGERGHVFQGRYQSLLVEAGEALGHVSHYLHLNPVRAGIVPAERLGEYRHSSYWYLRRKRERPSFMRVETALAEAGGLPDDQRGWEAYGRYLAWQAADGPAGKTAAYVSLSRGWALGSGEFKQALLKDHAVAAEARAWESQGVREVRRLRWEQRLAELLAALPETEKRATAKAAPWKVAVAARMRQISDVPNAWLAEQLRMGSGFYVSKHTGRLRRETRHPAAPLLDQLAKVKGTA